MKNEFEQFLRSPEITPPEKVSEQILVSAKTYMNPSLSRVALKYVAFFAASIFLSLAICPQSGISFIRSEFPLFHKFLHQNILLCGMYCAFVFFFTTHTLAFLFLNRFEKMVFSRRLIFLPLIPLSLSFGMFMVFSPVEVFGHFWNKPYTVTWLATAFVLFVIWKVMTQKIFGYNRTFDKALQ